MSYQEKLRELERCIKYATDESKVRPEHSGYDLAIDSRQVEPLIKELEESQEPRSEADAKFFERLKAERERLLRRPKL